MQPTDPAHRQHVLARLSDYFMTEGISWTRRLWDIGSVLALHELWELGIWQSRKVIAPAAMDWQRRQLLRLVGPDVGVGKRELRHEIIELLKRGELADPSPGHRRLRQLVDHARAGYLDRWAAALATPPVVKPERLARTVAAHLLDLGYTPTFLASGWISQLRRDQASVEQIIDSAAALARQPERTFEVQLALDTIPERAVAEGTEGWLSRGQVTRWLKANGHDVAGMRSGGGFVYRVSARDPYGAADQVRQIYERLLARSMFIRRHRGGLAALPHLWVAGHVQPLPLAGQARSADVLALSHMQHLYAVHGRRSPR